MLQQENKIIAIPALSDNYIWAIINPNNQHVALVDPGQASPCIAFIEKHKLILSAILITHHHIDHVGGIDELKTYSTKHKFPLVIYGPAFKPLANSENLPIPKKHNKHTDIIVSDDSALGQNCIHITSLNLSLNIMDLTGHTLEHIAYYNHDVIFSGDTLFSGGCGRIFEGSPEQMFTALTKISTLPASTKVYCTHEYTQSNLVFALAVEPNNQALKTYIDEVAILRKNKKITLPTNIAHEKNINPFLRSNAVEVIASAKKMNKALSKQKDVSSLDVFTTIRQWKNVF